MANDFDWTKPLQPHDPREILDGVLSDYRNMPDEQVTKRLQMSVERLRNSLRSIMPEANITDTFEGLDAAAAALVLKERHG